MSSSKLSCEDHRLTEDQQLAVVGHCMMNPNFYDRNRAKLPPNYFVNLLARNLYEYIRIMNENGAQRITGAALKELMKQYQGGDPSAQARYCDLIERAEQLAPQYTGQQLQYLLQLQRRDYEYIKGMTELSKHAGAGRRDKAMEVVEKLAELNKVDFTSQPTTDENIVALNEEEAKWEKNLLNRVPLITPDLNRTFTLVPGITIVGGVTKSGKSTFLANLVPAILDAKPDKKVLIISNEDNLNLVATRIACCIFGVSVKDYQHHQHKLPPEAVQAIRNKKRDLMSRIAVASMPKHDTATLEVVQDLLENAKHEDYSTILLDYYQIVAHSRENPKMDYIFVAKKFGAFLKGYAADLAIPMVMFAQLKPHTKDQDTPFQQRVQADQTIANHVHVALEIVKSSNDLGPTTEVICHLSRHGDIQGKIATFQFYGGQLRLLPRGNV